MASIDEIIALSFGVTLTPGLLANIFLIVIILRFKMMEKHENLIFYRLVFNLVIIDTLELINIVYLTLTIWYQVDYGSSNLANYRMHV